MSYPSPNQGPGYPGTHYTPGPGPMPPPRPPGNKTPILLGVIAALVLVLGVMAALLVRAQLSPARPDSGTQTAAPMPTTQDPVPTVPTLPPEPTTEPPAPPEPTTEPPAPPEPTDPPPPPPPEPTTQAPKPVTTAPPQHSWPPAGATLCDQWLAVNSSTSCSFAYQMIGNYQGPGTYTVWSPVTNQNYRMTCSAATANVIKCTGGNNAVVWIRQ